ncbi:unnamed protein product [Malus baccata var. baccata]
MYRPFPHYSTNLISSTKPTSTFHQTSTAQHPPPPQPIMAATSSALFSAPSISSTATRHHQTLSPTQISFQGLRPLTKSSPPTKLGLHAPSTRRSSCVVKAELNPSLVISLSTGLSLFLGRFVFFNFQRENVAKQGLPEQNGVTHFEAGDTRAKEYPNPSCNALFQIFGLNPP